MDQGFSGEDLTRVIYLLLYLLVVVFGLRGMSRRAGAPAEPRPGPRGWMDAHPWAVGGAVWAFIIWGLLAARLWWLGEAGPPWLTLPVTVLSGFGLGWILARVSPSR